MRIEHVPFTIVGLLASRAEIEGGDDQDDVIVTPLVTAKTRVLGVSAAAARAVGNIVVKVRDDRDVADGGAAECTRSCAASIAWARRPTTTSW